MSGIQFRVPTLVLLKDSDAELFQAKLMDSSVVVCDLIYHIFVICEP